MRLLVGTMHTIEQEFDDCVAAIRRQKGCDFEHFVIENKAHLEGHRLLYGTFMARAGEFDIFLKVDADMVIARDNLFAGIADRFQSNPAMQWLMIAIHDFFPDRLVRGMHAFRNTVKWPVKDEKVFVDECPVSKQQSESDYDRLAPAAIHCPNPSSLQAFHYGLIRGVKVKTGLTQGWLNSEGYGLIEDTWKHAQMTQDHRLMLASLGAELGLGGVFGKDDLDHHCPLTAQKLGLYEEMSSNKLSRLISARRIPNRIRHLSLLLPITP